MKKISLYNLSLMFLYISIIILVFDASFFFYYIKDTTIYDTIFGLFKNSDFFYVKMVEAWVLSYLYIYDSKKTYDFLFSSDISFDIKNMAIRKILDSYRVNKDEKEKVKALRTLLKDNKK